MMGAIHLNHEAFRVAVEVEDIAPEGLLAAELRAGHLSIA
jgi:hypothetical protein